MRIKRPPHLTLAALLLPVGLAYGKAILGVDLGSLYMKVALVQRNSPLEIVTNLHSKRKTEQMVLFDAGTRFYGADASSLLARKPHLTPAAMSVMLGRDQEHPTVQVLAERHYPITPSYNETRSGVCLTVDGKDFTPEELVAMVLTHAKDITAAYGVGTPVKDCVLTVPSFYTQHERRALMDAAELADLNVLALINENTAAALHFGIDRIDETPQNYVFYNMGAGALQVSVVRYFSYDRKESKYGKEKKVGAFEILGTGWDSTLGGEAFDSRLVDLMADEFNEVWNKKRADGETKDIRNYPRPMTKLRIQANKVKHVLSANNDIPVFIDSLYDDTNYETHISRAKFEEVCHDLLHRAADPIHQALKAANLTLEEIHAIEMIGGGMRIPKVQEEVSKALGEHLDLGMHLNSDESMALGAAFHGANVSTAFRVRHVGMADVNPFPISIDLSDLAPAEGEGEEEEAWSKHATVFKSYGKIGIKKTIAFTHGSDVHCSVDYEENVVLPKGTEPAIERYEISGVETFAKEMAEKDLATPKVSLQFELSTSGLVRLVKAEAAVEEIVIVQEEVEVEDDEEEGTKGDETAAAGEEKAEAAPGEAKEEAKDDDKKEEKKGWFGRKKKDDSGSDDTKEKEKGEEGDKAEDEKVEGEKSPEEGDEAKADGEEKKEEKKEEEKPKKKKTKMVEKEKKKVHKRTLTIKTSHAGRIKPYTPEIMTESKTKLEALAQKDKERMMLEESRNKVESYIYSIKNKMIDDEENIAKVTTEEQRAAVVKSAEDAEEWMYEDGYGADLATFEDKYAELSGPAEKIFFRVAETTARPAAVEALRKKLEKVVNLMTKWETTMPQVTEEERGEVLEKVEEVRKWIAEKEEAQSNADPTEDPVFVSEDVPLQSKPIESLVGKLSKKPKPKPVEEEKKNDTDASEGEASPEGEKKEGEEGAAEGEAKDDEATEKEGDAEEAKADEAGSESDESTEEEKGGTEGEEL